MKILILSSSLTHKSGGVYNAVKELFTNRNFLNIEKHLLTIGSDSGDNEWKDIYKEHIDDKYGTAYHKIKNILLETTTDIIHIETLWRLPHLMIKSWKRHRKEPIVCSPHGMLDPYIVSEQGYAKRLIAKLFFDKPLHQVDCFHALCKKELEDIRSYGIKQPIAIIPNGVHLPDFNKTYPKTDDRKHLLYLGRLHKKKGVDILLLALAEIKEKHPDLLHHWQVDIVGWDDGNEAKKLKELAKQCELSSLVTFHGGLFGEEKQKMYATCDAYILPSHGEGLPLTVLEAWAWKKAVVMTPCCNIPEGFDANAAIRIDDTVEGTVKGLTTLFSMSDTERKDMGLRGYDLVKKSFTWDEAAKKMVQLYKWLRGEIAIPDFVFL